jgi:DNA-binding IclR family transcriptional regulator
MIFEKSNEDSGNRNSTATRQEADTVHGQRLMRIFDVIGHVAEHGSATASEIAIALDIPLSSAHDLLHAMVAGRLLHVTARRYGVGPRTIRAAIAVMNGVGVQQIAHRHLQELVDTIGFDVYLATNSGSRVIYVSRFAGRQRADLDVELGRSLLLHCTAVGKLYAAFDPPTYRAMLGRRRQALTPHTLTTRAQLDAAVTEIRERRVSVSRGESIEGLLGFATPVFDCDGTLTAAVHVCVPSPTLPAERFDEVVAEMTRTSLAIEEDLGGIRSPVSA